MSKVCRQKRGEMMTPEKPIYGKEGQEVEKTISRLIGRHNVLCRIEEKFTENNIASEYFENAREEVLDSGNQSLAVMFAIAIENMAEFIDDYKDDQATDVDKLKSRIYSLESENRKLKMKLENITKVVNS